MTSHERRALAQTLQPDVPLEDPAQDAFDRRPFAEGIARAISCATLAEGFVIGIHGPWGDGKSTVLNFIARDLRSKDIPLVRYNPWRFTDEDRMIAAFFEDLATSAGAPRSKIRRLISEYGGMVGDIAELANETASKAARTAIKLMDKSLEERHAELVALMRQRAERRVVLIDDVDRLDKHELFTLFRMIKASADLPGVIYVLAFDDAAVADALQERYGGHDPRAGRRFLEKIVQLPLILPPADPAALERELRFGLDATLDELAIQLSDRDRLRFDYLFTVGVRQGVHTPRQVKQYVNACRFALTALLGEANAADVLLIEALRVIYPGVHAIVRSHQEWFQGVPSHPMSPEAARQTLEILLNRGLEVLPQLEQGAVSRLLEGLFPRFGPEKLGLHLTPASLGRWQLDRRVCSPAYCGRYFSYAVARTDVSDATITDLMAEAERPDSRRLPSIMAEVLSPIKQESGLRRVRQATLRVSPTAARHLARGIATRADSLAEPFSLYLPGVGVVAAELAGDLIRATGDLSDGQLAAWVISETPTPWFAGAAFNRVDPPPSDPSGASDGGGLGPVAKRRIREAMGDRIQLEVCRGMKTFTLERRWQFELLFIWARCAGREAVSDRFIPEIRGNRNIAVALLKCLTQPLSDPNEIIPGPRNLQTRHIQELALIIDPQALREAIVQHQLVDLCFEPDKWAAIPIEKRLLSQFAFAIERGPTGLPTDTPTQSPTTGSVENIDGPDDRGPSNDTPERSSPADRN